MHDLVIRGGTVVDGTGAARRTADVAIDDGVIVEVGKVASSGSEEIDADGAIVMPGIVDVHTHYDGQVTWDDLLTPSCWHGVTTMVMGNCGVGFAPVEPDRREWLIGLMEGVEDIPGSALSDGIKWEWETYPEYLDAIGRRKLAVDVGSLIPHGAVRSYVMGERGAKNEAATEADIAAMAEIVRVGMTAGALGVSTSRTIAHAAIDGEPVPGTFAAEAELFGLGQAMADVGHGVFELAPAGVLGEDLAAPDREMAWMRRLAGATKLPVVFALLQNDAAPDDWRRMLDLCSDAAADGAPVRPQVAGRPINLLLGLQTFHPFAYCASWSELKGLKGAPRVARLCDPDLRSRLLAEADDIDKGFMGFMDPERAFAMGAVPDYAPAKDRSIGALARARGMTPLEFFYDTLLEDDGAQLIMRPLLNYTNFTLDPVREMLLHPTATWGQGDGGAHCGTTCDASTPTFMLSHWVRDRGDEGIPLERAVKIMTSDTAGLFGMADRGVLAPGMLADVNVVDLEGLTLHRPVMVNDLPADARRFIQTADGWLATIKSGQVTFRNGEDQGARPAGLVRGGR